jgi:hypothetical protein
MLLDGCDQLLAYCSLLLLGSTWLAGHGRRHSGGTATAVHSRDELVKTGSIVASLQQRQAARWPDSKVDDSEVVLPFSGKVAATLCSHGSTAGSETS